MEVALPSGYTAEVEALPSITRAKEVKRIDTSDGDTNVIIYMDRVRTLILWPLFTLLTKHFIYYLNS